MPDQVDYKDALACADTFRHLVETIWPQATVLENTEPKDEFDPAALY